MGLTERLARFAYRCPRPLLVLGRGATATRLAIERELRVRGGQVARSAAEADTLLVCGSMSGPLAEATDRIWAQVPAPRARIALGGPADAPSALEEAAARLVDVDAQRRPLAPEQSTSEAGDRTEQDEQDEQDDGGDEEMSMPGGLMMADRGPDRDGLMLDQLHVQLGPVLPDWPAGLLVRVTLQGDVIQDAEVDTVPPGPGVTAPAFWDEPAVRAARGEPVEPAELDRRRAAAHTDSAARLLQLAGWSEAAVGARRLRDELLEGRTPAAELARLARRVRRSRVLHWLLADLGPLTGHEAVGASPVGAAGDVWDRLTWWLDEAAGAAAGRPGSSAGPRRSIEGRAPAAALLDVVPEMLTGLDLAAARLVIASLDPDLDQLLGTRAEVGGG